MKRCLEGINKEFFYIHIESGGTFAQNCNNGARCAKTDTLIFLNDDVEARTDALLKLARAKYDYCGISQYIGSVKYYGMGYRNGRWIMANKEEDNFIPSGYCVKFTKGAWEKLRGFDEQFKNGGEDMDIGLRALKMKLKIGFIDNPMIHKHSQSEGRFDHIDRNCKLLKKLWPNKEIEKLTGGSVEAKNVPVLFTTYNRLEYTKVSLEALKKSICGEIIVIDNASTDGTREWLKKQSGIRLILNNKNTYVAGAMNKFFEMTAGKEYVAKVDNDTIVPKNWLVKMLGNMKRNKVDIVQAKHTLISSTCKKDFKEWVKDFPKRGPIRINNFVGGSGTVIRRSVINQKLHANNGVLSGWTYWQHNNPSVIKGFDTSVEIFLLDTDKDGYKKYPKYYKFTKRK